MSTPLDKLDAPLNDLRVDVSPFHLAEIFVPVIIRCDWNAWDVENEVVRLGGWIEHRLHVIQAVTAYVPGDALEPLAKNAHVYEVELSQRLMEAAREPH